MADLSLHVLTICGSLRKGSYNAMVQRALPSLAPEGIIMKPAPSFAEFPLERVPRAGQHHEFGSAGRACINATSLFKSCTGGAGFL